MSLIHKYNIVQFIAQLYRERKGTEAPQALLQSWSHLSDQEIDHNLKGLFESWGMGVAERQRAMERFVQQRSTSLSSREAPYDRVISDIPGHVRSKRKPLLWLWVILGVLILVGGYLGYQYVKFISLTRIYAITENIAVRDIQGKLAARMDLYPKTGTAEESYSSLRVLDDEVYYKQPEGSDKEYPTRMVILDHARFADFLLRKDKIVHFVNINYIVNDKKEFGLYQHAFKEIQAVPSDNARLIAVYRKIIVGSMVQNDDLAENYIMTRTMGLSSSLVKGTEGFIIRELKKGSEYAIIAGLDNGTYYQFKGDISTNRFESPVIVQLQSQDGQQGNLGGNYRFVRSGVDWKLFNTDEKKVTNYYLDKNTQAGLFYYKTPEPTEEEQAQRAEEINNTYHQSNTLLQPQSAEQYRPGLTPDRE